MDKNHAEIIVASSETDANLYYATRFLVPDPVLFIKIKNKKYLILNDLEVDRGRKQANVDVVYSQSELSQKVKKQTGKAPNSIELLTWFLKEKKVSGVVLPHTFPAFIASELAKIKFKITFRPDPFWPDRIYKTPEEKKAIKEALKFTGLAIQKGYDVLRKSTLRGKSIFYKGEPLTSEKLRQAIDFYLMENGFLAQHTIVAGGKQAVDPHNRGSGKLSAHQAIVMDVFPRSMKTQYHADMTRTVVKGKPSPELKKMWHAVKEAQERAFGMIKDGVNGKTVHDWIMSFFESKGYKTGVMGRRMQGFFHGTGHGLGLDIHEPPRISRISEILKEGTVVTVEPGLYYEKIGGVRIEDVVYVTKNGCEVLSSCPKILSID